jgi:hypothetical protein
LGSTRLVTKGDATVDKTYDYLPFGELIGASYPSVPSGPGQKFTGQEHGVMYRSSLGRGVNVAVFDPSLARVVNRFMFDMSSIQFSFSAIPTPPKKPTRKQ